ncbi:pilus assembly FimT family protein [Metabacillus fastidiosus]|uniref:pilus assembly FimT family protein n=1 Tax=Metabacillus fastidiosus TaxID=1458 RepID=UPI003D284573
MKKIVKNQRGLTLIELLAVIVILGIIAAIAIPAVNAIMNKSKDEALVVEARSVLNAAKMYVAAEDPGSKDVSKGTEELKQYIDNAPHNYSIKIIKNATTTEYSFTNISVTNKSGKTETFADVAALDAKKK